MQYVERDWAYLKIQPNRQITLSGSPFPKLSAKYYEPYQILQKVGKVAYKLSLPVQLLLHPTFYVSQLNLCHKVPEKINHPPVADIASPCCPQPLKILDRHMIQKGNKAVAQVLIQWDQLPAEQATWEDYHTLKIKFPSFLSSFLSSFLEVKEIFNRGKLIDKENC